ncbi:hypothetical protein RUM44_009550 [Polyplax serrata]|uniref:Ig-like domain-containing protein n=1 Tax=Polyplax serrata TaxID=468196 RepID=A0ABR1AT05_POLSC
MASARGITLKARQVLVWHYALTNILGKSVERTNGEREKDDSNRTEERLRLRGRERLDVKKGGGDDTGRGFKDYQNVCFRTGSPYEQHLRGPSFHVEPPAKVEFSNTSGSWIDCTAFGNPPPAIDWISIDGSLVEDVLAVRRVLKNGTLVLLPFGAAAYRQDIHNTVYRDGEAARRESSSTKAGKVYDVAFDYEDDRSKKGTKKKKKKKKKIVDKSNEKTIKLSPTEFSQGKKKNNTLPVQLPLHICNGKSAKSFPILLFVPGKSGRVHEESAPTYASVPWGLGQAPLGDPQIVAQAYKVSVEVLSASRGCTAILKCVVPSFVKELVKVVSWVQDPATYLYPKLQGDSKYHVLPTGELLIHDLQLNDQYPQYRCRTMHRLTRQVVGSPPVTIRISAIYMNQNELPNINHAFAGMKSRQNPPGMLDRGNRK